MNNLNLFHSIFTCFSDFYLMVAFLVCACVKISMICYYLLFTKLHSTFSPGFTFSSLNLCLRLFSLFVTFTSAVHILSCLHCAFQNFLPHVLKNKANFSNVSHYTRLLKQILILEGFSHESLLISQLTYCVYISLCLLRSLPMIFFLGYFSGKVHVIMNNCFRLKSK